MIRDVLQRNADNSRCAVIADGREITYGEIINKAYAVQAIFHHAEKSEPVAVLLPDGSDFIAAFYGVLQANMVALPMHTQLKKDEIARLLQHTKIKTIITCVLFRPLVEEIQSAYAVPLRVVFAEELQFLQQAQDSPLQVTEDDPMVLLSTSGTVGKPKIVQLSERNILTSVQGYLEKLQFAESELESTRYYLAAPFSSAYGIMIVTACLMMGFPLIVTSGTFTLDGFFMAAQRDKVTHYEGGGIVIQLMEKMLGRPIGYDISTLRFFGFGGGPVSGKTIEAVQNAYPGIAFYQGYGMTESAPLITKFQRGVPVRAESVGTAINGVTLAVKTLDGITHSPWVHGEVVVRGDNVMLGYYLNEAETNRVIVDGYLHTGDMGYLDENGYLFLRGRKKNIILVRGFTVYPEEVESCLLNSGLVSDCFVYGKVDETGQERVSADVVLLYGPKTLDEIAAYCRVNLAGYKQPRQYFIREEIKKTLYGKIER